MKTKWIVTRMLWVVVVAAVWFTMVVVTDWITEGGTTVGPFLG